ncbi:hypothetical protein ACQY0O_005187 [Thecaphora frezii]
MRVGLLYLVVLVVALVAIAAPVETTYFDWAGEALLDQFHRRRSQRQGLLDAFKAVKEIEASPKFKDLVKKLEEPQRSAAGADQVLQKYYIHLEGARDNPRMLQTRDISSAKKMLLKQIREEAKQYGQEWKQVVFHAVRTVDSHIVGLFFTTYQNQISNAYAMAYHALQVSPELRQDVVEKKLRYDLFPDAAVRALLPWSYDDIEKASTLQDGLLDILYPSLRKGAKNRDILAQQGEDAENRDILAQQGEDAENRDILAQQDEGAENRDILAQQGEDAENRDILAQQGEDAENRDILAQQDEGAENRDILAHRFAEAYIQLKVENPKPISSWQEVPQENMVIWLEVASQKPRSIWEFMRAFRAIEVDNMRKPPTASQAASSSAARFAMLPEQQQHHAALASPIGPTQMQPPFRGHPHLGYDAHPPPNDPQAGPSQQHGRVPLGAGYAGYPSTGIPSLPSHPPNPLSASPYPQGSGRYFPRYEHGRHPYFPGSARPAGPASGPSTQAPRGNPFPPVPRQGAMGRPDPASAMYPSRPVLGHVGSWGTAGTLERPQGYHHAYAASGMPPFGAQAAWSSTRPAQLQEQEQDLISRVGIPPSPGTQEHFDSDPGRTSSNML